MMLTDKRRLLWAGLVVAGVAAMSGCSASTAPDDASTTEGGAPAASTAPVPGATETTPAADASARTATALTAIDTAEKAVSDGQVFDLELDTDDGVTLWEVKVAGRGGTQFDLELSEDGTTVQSKHEDTTPDDDIAKLATSTLTVRDALAAAAEHADGDAKVTAAEIDRERDGTITWEVTLGGDDGITVVMDAADGRVIRSGPDAG